MRKKETKPKEITQKESLSKKGTEVVLVTTSTGNIGKHVALSLLKRGFIVKAATRDITNPTGMAKKLSIRGAELVELNFNKPETIEKALQGVDKMFFNVTFSPEFLRQGKVLFEAVAKSKVKFICKISTMEIGLTQDIVALWHEKQEEDLKALNIPCCILRGNGYAQNLSRVFKMPIKHLGLFPSPFGEGKVAYVDCRDIAAVAVETLCRPDEFVGKMFYLHGPEILNHEQVAQIITRVTGRKIKHVMVSGAEFKARVKRFVDVPDHVIDLFIDMCEQVVKTNISAVTNNSIQEILGRPATRVEQYIRDHIEDFTAPLITTPQLIQGTLATVIAVAVGAYFYTRK